MTEKDVDHVSGARPTDSRSEDLHDLAGLRSTVRPLVNSPLLPKISKLNCITLQSTFVFAFLGNVCLCNVATLPDSLSFTLTLLNVGGSAI